MTAYGDSSVLLRIVLGHRGDIATRREASGGDLVMATHDAALGTAARACGLRVVGTA